MIRRSSTNIRACTYRSAHVVYKIVLFSKRRNELDEYIYENNRYQYISYRFDITRMCFKHNVSAALSTIFIWEILLCKDAKKLDLDLFLCNFKNKLISKTNSSFVMQSKQSINIYLLASPKNMIIE